MFLVIIATFASLLLDDESAAISLSAESMIDEAVEEPPLDTDSPPLLLPLLQLEEHEEHEDEEESFLCRCSGLVSRCSAFSALLLFSFLVLLEADIDEITSMLKQQNRN